MVAKVQVRMACFVAPAAAVVERPEQLRRASELLEPKQVLLRSRWTLPAGYVLDRWQYAK